MYAIVEVGAKQYKVQKDDLIEVEKQDKKEGAEFALDKVLLVAEDTKIEIGRPYLKEAKVTAEVLDNFKGKKVISHKYRRRKAFHWTKGHRQQLTLLKIKDIKLGG